MGAAPLIEIPDALLHAGERRDGLLAGVDGGATKTLAAVLDPVSGALHTVRGPAANPSAMSAERTVDALHETLGAALEAAGAREADVAHAVVAVASAELGIGERFAARAPLLRAHVVGDVVAAWASVAAGAPAIGAISGTGSNVLGVGAGAGEHRAWRAGGWGHLLGDEGSGWWIARAALAAVLRERDASGPATALSDAAREHFGVSDTADVQRAVYAEPFSKASVAAFAPRVDAAAAAGDDVAAALLRRAGEDLAQLIATVAERVGLPDARAGTIGSTWHATAMRDACERALARLAPDARLVAPALAPWGGALVLAARGAGLDPDAVARLVRAA